MVVDLEAVMMMRVSRDRYISPYAALGEGQVLKSLTAWGDKRRNVVENLTTYAPEDRQ